jgi:hypothetical protein
VTVPTYSQDPLHLDRLRWDRCGQPVAGVGGKECVAVESLTARQVQDYFPGAAGGVELHEVVCGWGGRKRRAMGQRVTTCLTCRARTRRRRSSWHERSPSA